MQRATFKQKPFVYLKPKLQMNVNYARNLDLIPGRHEVNLQLVIIYAYINDFIIDSCYLLFTLYDTDYNANSQLLLNLNFVK